MTGHLDFEFWVHIVINVGRDWYVKLKAKCPKWKEVEFVIVFQPADMLMNPIIYMHLARARCPLKFLSQFRVLCLIVGVRWC